jgi:hypothetical protein
VTGPKRQSLEYPDGSVSEVVPPPNYREANRLPQRSDGGTPPISAFDSAGRCVSVPLPGQIAPAPPPESIVVRMVDIPPSRMPPDLNGYDARFVPGESSLITVPNAGKQPGEGRSGEPSIPRSL